MNQTVNTNNNLKQLYDNYYTGGAEDQWRMMGAKHKFQNIKDLTQGQNFRRVLEVGAGDGSILHYIDNDSSFCDELYALEISESGIEAIQQRQLNKLVEVKSFDGYHIPYSDNMFDLVIFSHVLEHVEFPRMILRELRRIARFQLIEVPRDYKPNADRRIAHFLSYGHIWIFTPTLLRYLLKSEQFEILHDKMSFTHPELLRYQQQQQGKSGALATLRLSVFLTLRRMRYLLSSAARKETMINAYTVLTKAETS